MATRRWKVKEQPWFAQKAYKDGIVNLEKQTCALSADLDEKAIRFLDFIQETEGRGNEACQFLIENVKNRSREQVSDWKKYLYTILRGFDNEAYKQFKGAKKGRERGCASTGATQPFAFNVKATEFVPGLIDVNAFFQAPSAINSAVRIPEENSSVGGGNGSDVVQIDRATEMSVIDIGTNDDACEFANNTHKEQVTQVEERQSIEPNRQKSDSDDRSTKGSSSEKESWTRTTSAGSSACTTSSAVTIRMRGEGEGVPAKERAKQIEERTAKANEIANIKARATKVQRTSKAPSLVADTGRGLLRLALSGGSR